MSRYIDADKLIAEMSEKHRPNFHEDLKSYHMWIMWYWALKDAPSIDIVRCKECKHCHYEQEDDIYHCYKLFHRFYDTEHYCSYGERRDHE